MKKSVPNSAGADQSSKYPRPLYNMEKNLNVLLRYHDYPESIKRSIHSTNLIERMNKEIRRGIKSIEGIL